MPNISYKIYQLLGFFILKFSYKNIYLGEMNKPDELFLVNYDSPKYQIIRLTTRDYDSVYYDKDRIEKIIASLSRSFSFKMSFLDIHIGHNNSNPFEYFDTISIDTNYYSGIDISSQFPGIKNVIHEVENGQSEINNIVLAINNDFKNKRKQVKKLRHNTTCLGTYIIIGINIIVYLIQLILKIKGYDEIASAVVVGADYKIFTLGLKQFWRLLSVGFVHSSPFHMFMNMYSLYMLGRIYEYEYGHLKFILVYLLSILAGSLTFGIFTSNDIALGASAGLYGWLAFYVLDNINNPYGKSNFYYLLLINLALNFYPNVAWQAHLGGFMVGFIFYFMFKSQDIKPYVFAMVALFIVLGFKYFTNDYINPFYSATDMEVLDIYRSFGFKKFSENMLTKLLKIYMR